AAFFDAANHPISAPATQTLTLSVDNNVPTVTLDSLKHSGKEILPCEIVQLTSGTDSVQVTYTVNDPEGHLLDYFAAANYGAGGSAAIDSAQYSPLHSSPPHSWTGVSGQTSNFVPPVSCAYEFVIGGRPNVTNGYPGVPGYTQATRFVTILKPPGTPVFVL